MPENEGKQQEPQQQAQESAQAEPQGAKPDEGEGLTDAHGQAAVSAGKYEREVRERDERIAALEAQVAEAARTEKAASELREQIEALKAEMADRDEDHALEMAGCRSAKAAKALLADYGGDVAALKAAQPWMFEPEKRQQGATGLPPAGAPDATEERRRKARQAAGLKD